MCEYCTRHKLEMCFGPAGRTCQACMKIKKGCSLAAQGGKKETRSAAAGSSSATAAPASPTKTREQPVQAATFKTPTGPSSRMVFVDIPTSAEAGLRQAVARTKWEDGEEVSKSVENAFENLQRAQVELEGAVRLVTKKSREMIDATRMYYEARMDGLSAREWEVVVISGDSEAASEYGGSQAEGSSKAAGKKRKLE